MAFSSPQQLPPHTHTIPSPSNTTTSTGASFPIGSENPGLGLIYIIALQGVYPSRNRRRRILQDKDEEATEEVEAEGWEEEKEGENGQRNGHASHGRKLVGTDPFVGQLGLCAGNFAPAGFALCWGQLLPISSNTALFSLLGTTYGGDGRTTFALPDLRRHMAVGQDDAQGLSLGTSGGSNSITLTVPQLPRHSHTLLYNNTTPPLSTTTGSTDNTEPFDNRKPFLAINYIISLEGIISPRNRRRNCTKKVPIANCKEILPTSGKS